MKDMKLESFKRTLKFISPNIGEVLKGLEDISNLCEIRLKADSPVVLIFTDSRKFITPNGRLSSFLTDNLLISSSSEVNETFNMMCEYSVHSHVESIANGFITVDGGNRVGVYGTAVTQNDRVTSVRNIKGLNIRISGQFENVARPIVEKLYSSASVNTLICGPPSSGKTTLLKDFCKIASDEYFYRIAAIDERDELCGKVGVNTDVLTGYPKAQGIQIAVRTLSPDIIVCDEIGTYEEAEAIADGLNSGVNFVLTVHCRNEKELIQKPQFSVLKNVGAIDWCVFLGEGKCNISKIIPIGELENENCRADSAGCGLRAYGSVHSLQA